MDALRKERMKTRLKYTWPFYIAACVTACLLMTFLFGVTHRLPEYQKLTIFVSGEVTDSSKLKSDLLKDYGSNELKSVSLITVKPNSPTYDTQLSIVGYNSADLMILPYSKMGRNDLQDIALKIEGDAYYDYLKSKSYYTIGNFRYGVRVNRGILDQYMNLPNEDCYIIVNAKSQNIGRHYKMENKEHDNALRVARDWSM